MSAGNPIIQIVQEKMDPDLLRTLTAAWFGDMIKVVVDIRKGLIAAGGMLHADGESILMERGSRQEDLWGANIYPYQRENRVEYTALINIRPGQNNPGMEIEDGEIRRRVQAVIEKCILGPDEKLVQAPGKPFQEFSKGHSDPERSQRPDQGEKPGAEE